MAEMIGLIASIGTIASAGFAVAKAISDLADELGSAGRYVKAISTDTKAVALILHEMKRRSDRSTKITQQTFDVANDIVNLCKADLDNIKQFLLPVVPAVREKMIMAQKTRWILAKSKIAAKRSSLDSLKLTITLFLHTLDFIEGDLLNEDYTKDEIQNMVAESKNTKSVFLATERTDQTLEKAYAIALTSSAATQADGDGIADTDGAIRLLHYGDQFQEQGTPILKGRNDQEDDANAIKFLQTNNTSQLSNQLSDFQMIESLSDDHFLHIAWHVRTQITVASYALVVFDGRHEKEGLTSNGPFDEARVRSNESREPATNDPQEVNPHLSEDFPAYDGTSYTSTVNERSSQWDESESGFSSTDAERVSVTATNADSATHVNERNHSDRGMRHTRQSGDRRPTTARADTQGTSKHRTVPEAFDHPGSQFNGPTYSGTPQHDGDWKYTAPPSEKPRGYGADDRRFVLPQRQPPLWQQHSDPPGPPVTEAPDIIREDPEKEEMKRQLAEIFSERERVEA
ncbi:hypothetical protein E0Z10_g6515 [Xylaria hypoxylon]|uniref:Fungal N-terminal domain-containing protein n=1 Tax=Xylaria hypoxylon TaxID=37992 RepID=A0A4Z0YDD3_9PEZI|nr:hypothetical protein E0Z10_g6515 [Xylaria hypoxylon]